MKTALGLLFVILSVLSVTSDLSLIVDSFLRGYWSKVRGADYSFFKDNTPLAEYDFIIVGSGAGGSVVANRLSEVPHWKILLLEAGREEMILFDIPLLVAHAQSTNYNWGFRSEKQDGACMGLTEEQCRWPRGKSLGGTTSINYLIYTRGNRADYDSWAANGNTGWSYNELLPYFLKSEHIQIPEYYNATHHQQGGPLNVERVPFVSPVTRGFVEAGIERGYRVIDYNSGQPPIGVSLMQENMVRGHRMSAAKAFLRPAKNRDNLHISQKSRVTKILIDPETKIAYGVEFVKNRVTYRARARKEVIMSAGAMQSPQLLMLSGIGPKEHLKELDIPVLSDLKVGHNLQEHAAYCGLVFTVNETGVATLEERILALQDGDIEMYLRNDSRGRLTLPGTAEALLYTSTKYNDDKWGRPDIELIFASGSIIADRGGALAKGIGVKRSIYNAAYRHLEGKESWTVLPMMLHPKSRGIVKLKSKNPWNWPLFYANYFQVEQDLNTVVEGIKLAVALSNTVAMKRFGSTLDMTPIPECASHPPGTDNYWRCAVRQLTMTLHHQAGTCKMGPPSDPDAVVDPELRVYGIHNLRVVDASIIPQLPTAHTTAPTYMIGEKASDMIKMTWLKGSTGWEPPVCRDCEPPFSNNVPYEEDEPYQEVSYLDDFL